MKMMSQLLILLSLVPLTQYTYAQSCKEISSLAEQSSDMYQPRLSFEVVGKKGFRSYFYAAPVEQCKTNNLFLIPKDSVIAYEEIRLNGQTWINVMYIRKNGSTVEGWMKKKDFRKTGRIGV